MSTINCPHCGEQHPATMRFCPKTGQPILHTSICPRCGNPVEDTWRVCASCGQPLEARKEEQVIRSRWWIAIVVLIALIGSAAGLYLWLNPQGFESASTSEVQRTSTHPQLPVLEGTPIPWPTIEISPENASQVVELARWGKGTINGLAWSPDGQQLALASSYGVYLYSTNPFELIKFVETDAWMRNIVFSPNRKIIVAGRTGRNIKVWDMSGEREIQSLIGAFGGNVGDPVVSPDGKILAVSVNNFNGRSWTVTLLEVVSGRKLFDLVHEQYVLYPAFSSDGRILASSPGDRSVRLWNVLSGEELRTLKVENSYPGYLAFSPDRRTLGVAYEGGIIRLWDIATGNELLKVSAEGDSVQSLSFSPDGKTLVSGDKTSGALKFWGTTSGQMLQTLTGHSGEVSNIDFSPDGKTLASGGWSDGTLIVWDVTSGEKLLVLTGFSRPFDAISYSPDGKTIGALLRLGALELRDVANGQVIGEISVEDKQINSFAFSPDGQQIAVGLQGGVIEIRDRANYQELSHLNGHTRNVVGLAFMPDGSRLISTSSDGTSILWEISSARELLRWEKNFDEFALSPDGSPLAYRSLENSEWFIELEDINRQKGIFTLARSKDQIIDIAFSPDGKMLALANVNRPASLWDVASGREIRTLGKVTDRVSRVAFSPNGKILATSSYSDLQGYLVQLWDITNGRELQNMSGHTYLPDLAFSPDGQVMISWSFDGTIRLWGVAP